MDLASKDQYIQRAESAKLDVGSTALTTVYTAPTGGDFDFAILDSILVANDATQATTVSFTITDSSSNNFVIFKDVSFTNKETKQMLSKSLIENRSITCEYKRSSEFDRVCKRRLIIHID